MSSSVRTELDVGTNTAHDGPDGSQKRTQLRPAVLAAGELDGVVRGESHAGVSAHSSQIPLSVAVWRRCLAAGDWWVFPGIIYGFNATAAALCLWCPRFPPGVPGLLESKMETTDYTNFTDY